MRGKLETVPWSKAPSYTDAVGAISDNYMNDEEILFIVIRRIGDKSAVHSSRSLSTWRRVVKVQEIEIMDASLQRATLELIRQWTSKADKTMGKLRQ